MPFRTVARLACAAAVLLAPAAHADTALYCATTYGSAIPHTHQCVGGHTMQPGCIGTAVYVPTAAYPVAGIEVCGL